MLVAAQVLSLKVGGCNLTGNYQYCGSISREVILLTYSTLRQDHLRLCSVLSCCGMEPYIAGKHGNEGGVHGVVDTLCVRVVQAVKV